MTADARAPGALPIVGLAVVAFILWMVTVTEAAAHEQLISSSPGADEHAATAPDSVTLRFDGRPLDIGATVLVVDASGRDHVGGPPRIEGNDIHVPLEDELVDGHYQVRWRIVSGDGAIVSGHYNFSVGQTTGTPTVPPPHSSDAERPVRTARENSGDFSQVPTHGALPQHNGSGETSPVDVVAAGVIGALAAVGALSVVRIVAPKSRRSVRNPTTQGIQEEQCTPGP